MAKRDMREKFLKYANKVLRFYAFWDDRGTMFGERMEYVINYFLAVTFRLKYIRFKR